MNVTYCCPKCQQTARVDLASGGRTLHCSSCQAELSASANCWDGGQLRGCLVCPSRDLFIRKDFPRQLGVAIVVAGFAASCVAWYFHMVVWTFGILFATALADVVVYAIVGDSLVCYRCSAEYRGLAGSSGHGRFQLETHERYRQQAARLVAAGGNAPRKSPPG